MPPAGLRDRHAGAAVASSAHGTARRRTAAPQPPLPRPACRDRHDGPRPADRRPPAPAAVRRDRDQGRRSGAAYRPPIVARRTEGGFVLPVPFGPNTNWVRNVLAAGEATITWKGGSHPVTAPRLVDLAAATPSLSGFMRRGATRFGITDWLEVRALAG